LVRFHSFPTHTAMADIKQLPHLLVLIDDESEDIRNTVLAELAAFGDELGAALAAMSPDLPAAEQREILKTVAYWLRAGADPFFAPGDLVRHARYGYRGVVVSVDLTCQADDSWYQRNRTQPDREQPWYHVLVDGSRTATYAAQSSLEADPGPGEIAHPLLAFFFDRLEGDKYIRNDRDWPG
jgi:heat shock protein HspQ